jgi:hypothetical protein
MFQNNHLLGSMTDGGRGAGVWGGGERKGRGELGGEGARPCRRPKKITVPPKKRQDQDKTRQSQDKEGDKTNKSRGKERIREKERRRRQTPDRSRLTLNLLEAEGREMRPRGEKGRGRAK